jgi:hypothetical protein
MQVADGSVQTPAELQTAGGRHEGPVVVLQVAPSAAADSHVPVVAAALARLQVPDALQPTRAPLTSPHVCPAAARVSAVQTPPVLQ